MPKTLTRMYAALSKAIGFLPSVPRNLLVTLLFLCIAYVVSSILLGHTGAENNSALVFVLAVVCISSLTDGYAYGIAASLVGGFCINYYFMFPYRVFSLSYAGYPVAMVSMVAISSVVCALTSRVKLQAIEAIKREQNTKTLYELNARLNEEKNAIQLEADRRPSGATSCVRCPTTCAPPSPLFPAPPLYCSPPMRSKTRRKISPWSRTSKATPTPHCHGGKPASITKIRDGVMPLNKQEEMLEEVAGDALLTIRRRFPAYHISLELSEDILYLPMEPMLIKQVMVNLLENAIRHSGDHDHIRLHLFRQDDWAVVEVRDRGKGISPEVRQAVQSGPSPVRPALRRLVPGNGYRTFCVSKHHQSPQRLLCRRQRPGGRSSLPFWPATGGNQR